MRIVDSEEKKDYYDCMQANDADKKTLYLRKRETIRFWDGNANFSRPPNTKEWPFPLLGYGRVQYNKVSLTQHMIGFCGKTYPYLEFSRWDQPYVHGKPVATYCRDLDETEKYLQANLEWQEWEQWDSKDFRSRRYPRHVFLGHGQRREEYKRFFEECKTQQDAYLKLFEEKRTPIFVASYTRHEGEITYNALLKPFEFFRVFDPPRAYQEIMMFMNNLAVPIKPIPKLDDVTMAEVKGFDKKYSFRKDPIRRRRR